MDDLLAAFQERVRAFHAKGLPHAICGGLRDLWVQGEYERIVALGKRLPSAVLDADETILMYVSRAGDHLTGGPATLTTT